MIRINTHIFVFGVVIGVGVNFKIQEIDRRFKDMLAQDKAILKRLEDLHNKFEKDNKAKDSILACDNTGLGDIHPK